MQIDFSAAFDRVNHLGILYKLCSVGIRVSVLSILTKALPNRSQQVMVDGCRSKLVNVVSPTAQYHQWLMGVTGDALYMTWRLSCLGLTRIQFHPPTVTPRIHSDEVTVQGPNDDY